MTSGEEPWWEKDGVPAAVTPPSGLVPTPTSTAVAPLARTDSPATPRTERVRLPGCCVI